MTCAVCILPLDEGQGLAIVQTACRHSFHLSCLVKCLEHRSTNCPICRQVIDTELTETPRPWMASAPNHLVASQRRSVLMGLGASETAVAVEIAESVRHTLMEDESRRAPTQRSREAAVGHRGGSGRTGMEMSLAAHIQLGQYNWDVPGEFHAVAVEIAESVRRSLMEDDIRWAPLRLGTGVPVLREIEPMIFPSSHRSLFQASRFSHDFSDEHAWYAEIAEAVVGSLAEEVAEQSRDLAEPVDPLVNFGVDPDALAGLAETVLHFQDAAMLDHYTSMLNPEPALHAQDAPEHTQPHGCLRAAEPPLGSLNLAGFSVSDSDIAGIAHAVLRSLDEDTAFISP